MIGLQLDDIHYTPAGHAVLCGLDWSIGERERIGLVGANGCGKSSLLHILAGTTAADAGRVQKRRAWSVGLLPQEVEHPAGQSLLDVAMVLPPELQAVEDELTRVEAKLGDPAVYGDEAKLARALEQQRQVLDRRDALGGASHASRVRGTLAQLGFVEADYSLPAESLSGGEKKLVALAALAVRGPDLLLLDEPDNHLDLEAKSRLEAFIRDYAGSVVIVSHDRYLLDGTALAIAELDAGKLVLYPGNYSAYVAEREVRRLRQAQRYADQQKEIARIEASIKRFELWASMVVNERHIKQARSRKKRLEKMESSGKLVDRPRASRRLELSIQGGRGSKKALEIEDLAMGFGDDLLFVGVDLLVRHGERVGLVGPNGCGKSLLLRLVRGELDALEGCVKVGPSTRVGYYAQQHETLARWIDRSPLELVRNVKPMDEGAGVSFLLRFLFQYDQVREPIHRLSGGERSRLQLACLVLENPNLLLLDEPTNNLDIPSAEALEGALEDFEGAILVVSHDRYFLDAVVDRVAAFEGGELVESLGGYTDYRAGRATPDPV
jgi:ATP-binding cassette subfamily F protein 3